MSLTRLVPLVCLLCGCVPVGSAAIDVSRAALIPAGTTQIAVTVLSLYAEGSLECTPTGQVRIVVGGRTLETTASLFHAELDVIAAIVGPVELARDGAEGAVVDGIPEGDVVVFAEAFGESGGSLGHACGTATVREGERSSVDLTFF